jgi:hypothetical protein
LHSYLPNPGTPRNRIRLLALCSVAAIAMLGAILIGARTSWVHYQLLEHGVSSEAIVTATLPALPGDRRSPRFEYRFEDDAGGVHVYRSPERALIPGDRFTVIYLPGKPGRHVIGKIDRDRTWKPLRTGLAAAAGIMGATLMFAALVQCLFPRR